MFRESIRHFVESTEGAEAGLLMDLEGIAVEAYSKEGSSCDIEVVGAEASVVVKAIQRAGEMLDVGQMREISFQSDQMTTLIRILNENYFVALTLGPGGNIGKGRYLLRTTAPALANELVSAFAGSAPSQLSSLIFGHVDELSHPRPERPQLASARQAPA